jgi:cytoskeletal protein CcmA (bactofilin family)
MASIIRIKRSDTSGSPSVLATGELAYSALPGDISNGGDRLYIGQGTETNGNAANRLVIGGKYFTDMLDHTPGTLTNSSAIVVDSNGKINILNVDNITLDGNTISSTNSNGNLVFQPNGSGKISFYNSYSFPTADGSTGFILSTDGSGNVSWVNLNSLSGGLATTATNIAGGTLGQIPYQTAPGATNFFGPGTAGQILLSGGTAVPVYTNTSSIYVGFADKAGSWLAARTLTLSGDLGGSVAFDGSGSFTLTATVQANSIALGTDTTGDYVATGATSGFGISGSTTGETATFTITSNATSTNANSTLVLRNASGNFSAGTITANLTGVATTATAVQGGTAGQLVYQTAPGTTAFAGPGTAGQILLSAGTAAPVYTNTASIYVGFADKAGSWLTARTLTLEGDLGGSVNIDGTGNVVLTATIQANSIALGTDTTGDYVATGATSGFGISGSTTGETATFTITSNATSTNANSTLVLRDASGNFSAGTITANLTGVATTATNVQGGTAGQLVYQTAPGTTAFAGPGTSGEVLVSRGTGAPTYQNTLTLAGSTNAVNTITGAFVTYGGVGIGKDVYIGGSVDILDTTANTGTVESNALYVAGGVGIEKSLYVKGPAVFQNNVVFAGTSTFIFSTQTVFTDNLVQLHAPAGSSPDSHVWTVDDGKDIGYLFHYYKNDDKDGFLGLKNDSGYLEWWADGIESGLVYTGTVWGTFKTGAIELTSSTNAISTTTGALQVAGGAGFGGNLYVGGNIFGNLTGVATTATNVQGGTAGQLVYQSGAGTTAFAGPGTAGQILLSGGTAAPVYTNTASIYVGVADKAGSWLAARTLTLSGDLGGSVAFDGTGNFTLTATVQANSIELGTDTTGDYVATGATSGFGISGSTTGENATFTVTSNATSTNAGGTLILRTASGNFSAGTVTANLTGVATTATNVQGGTAGGIPMQSASGVTTFISAGTSGQLLQSNGSTSSFVNTSSVHVGVANLATNLIGGASFSIPYQSVGNVTDFLAIGAAGKVLQVNTAGNALVYGDIDGGIY